ncbi:MAG: hypothetical protein COA73_18150 [Candidatus Hydrogenedentota bacterium]|nr:MAG: hypothetical protein COA73_18150 [Candidatus Hydrogenedentota bacterium]
MEEVEVFAGLFFVHAGYGGVGVGGADHGGADGVEGVGGCGVAESCFVVAQEGFVVGDGALLFGGAFEAVGVVDDGGPGVGLGEVDGDGLEIVGFHEGVGIEADEGSGLGVILVEDSQGVVQPDFAGRAYAFFCGQLIAGGGGVDDGEAEGGCGVGHALSELLEGALVVFDVVSGCDFGGAIVYYDDDECVG